MIFIKPLTIASCGNQDDWIVLSYAGNDYDKGNNVKD